MADVTVIDHPLVQHKLSIMRRKDTPTAKFRQLLTEIALLLGYEVTRDLVIETRTISTPLTEIPAPFLSGKKLALISILRAGNGLLEGMLDLVPSARVGHIGLYRDPETLVAVEYYFKVPDDLEDRPRSGRANQGSRGQGYQDGLSARVARGGRGVLPDPPRRTDLHRCHRLAPQRPRLHRAGTRRRGGPPLRNEVGTAGTEAFVHIARP